MNKMIVALRRVNMDMLFICRDAQASSIITNLLMALEAKRDGDDVAVLFTEESLCALTGEVFGWPRLLRDRDTQMKIAKSSAKLSMSINNPKDSREVDPKQLINMAYKKGVVLWACPIWTQLLGLEGKLPPNIVCIDLATMHRNLKECKRVIGAL